MGGTVALTIRTSETECYRGSCWTNVLSEGLFAADFYRDLDTSRNYTKTWLAQLLAYRAEDADLEDRWGGHNLLAPIGYGIVLVDYVTNTFISAQGYTNPGALFVFTGFPNPRHVALAAAGLLTHVPAPLRQFDMATWRGCGQVEHQYSAEARDQAREAAPPANRRIQLNRRKAATRRR